MEKQSSKRDIDSVGNSSVDSLDEKLERFFPSELEKFSVASRAQYSESDIREISRILSYVDCRWSRAPRTYIVLRAIRQLHLLDTLLNLGFNDLWFPVTANALPESLGHSVLDEFVKAQSVILNKAIDLETGKDGQHVIFANGETVPFEHIKRLGRGGFAQVDKVWSTFSKKEYARKRVKRGKFFRCQKGNVGTFMTELAVLKRIRHRHFVELLGSYTDPNYFGLIMSPVADMDLATFLAKFGTHPDQISLLQSFFGCLAAGLAYLHEQKIRHKDVKPQNILVKGGAVLFTDFGISYDWADKSRSTTEGTAAALSPKYCAPEVATYGPRGLSSDIWSLSCVFLEMVTVLRRETLEAMESFFKSSCAGTTSYQSNPDAVEQWIRKLRGDKSLDSGPLQWVRKMLREDRHARPLATELVGLTVQGDPPHIFCGTCCVPADDSPDGDDMISSDDVWSDDTLILAPQKEMPGNEATSGLASLVGGLGLEAEPGDLLRLGGAPKSSRLGMGDPEGLRAMEAAGVTEASEKTQKRPATEHSERSSGRPQKRMMKEHIKEIAHRSQRLPEINKIEAREVKLLEPPCVTSSNSLEKPSVEATTPPPVTDVCPDQLLLENGFNPNARRFDRMTALLWATKKSHLSVMKWLLEMDSDAHTIGGRYKSTALHEAAKHGQEMAALLLLKRGANIKAVDGRKHTALQLASRYGHLPVVKLLLGEMEDSQEGVGPQGEEILKAIQLATESGHEALVWYLLEKGKEVLSERVVLVHGMRWAAKGGHRRIVQSLLLKGASVESTGFPGGYDCGMWSALVHAVLNDRPEVAALLLEEGADPDAKSFCLRTPLHISAEHGDELMVQLLIENGATVDARSANEETPLIVAARLGHTVVVRLLLEHTANIEASGTGNCNHGTALVQAARRGYLELVRLLVTKRANLEARASDGDTALLKVACNGHTGIVWLLLQNGASIEARNSEGRTALIGASLSGRETIVKLLLEYRASIEATDNEGLTALHCATDHKSIFRLLMEAGADIHARSGLLGEVLQAACVYDCYGVAQFLLSKGADINAGGGHAGSALHAAAAGGNMKLVKLLLENGANWEAVVGVHGHVLTAAASSGHLDLVKLFVNKGADINPINGVWMGRALQAAAYGGFGPVVEFLLDQNVPVNFHGGKHGSVLSATATGGDGTRPGRVRGVVRLLLERGADVNAKDREGRTPLHEAAESGNFAIAQLLLKNGADINASSLKGTPLNAAARYCDVKIVALLLENGANPDTAAIEALRSCSTDPRRFEETKILIQEAQRQKRR